MKAVAKTLVVARSNLIDRLQGRTRPRQALLHTRVQSAEQRYVGGFREDLERDYVQVTPLPDAETVLG